MNRPDPKTSENSGVAAVPPDALPIFATTKGLRSVPYLVLCNTAMTETCALHLSFIIEGHHMPGQLLGRVPPAKAGPPAQQIMAYNESQCRGIIYHSNTQLGNAGLKVLQLAETKRDQRHHDASELDSKPLSDVSESSKSSRGAPKASVMTSNATTAKRRRSTQTGAIGDDGVATELDHARSKIQGNTLQEMGPSSNYLWRAALQLLAMGRYLLPQTSARRPTQSPTPAAPKTIIKTLSIPSPSKPKRLQPLTPLTIDKDPNRPMNPRNTNFRKKAEAVPAITNIITPTTLNPKSGRETPKIAAENKALPGAEKAYRSRLPCGFPEHAWAKILGHVVGVEGILSDDQQLSVLRYATDRRTLNKEREALGLASATQIWRVLEATGCLAYEMDV